MAAPVAPPDGDPFPLLHLADLDFALSSSSLADLAAYQLALAPWSTSCAYLPLPASPSLV